MGLAKSTYDVRCNHHEECNIGYRCGYGIGCSVNWHDFGAYSCDHNMSPVYSCPQLGKDVVLVIQKYTTEEAYESIW